jgi:hypothetical protein
MTLARVATVKVTLQKWVAGPVQPRKRIERGYTAANNSPFARLFNGYRRLDPGLDYLVPGNGSTAIKQKAAEWARGFRAGDPEYQTDEKWYAAAKQHDELVEQAKLAGVGAGGQDGGGGSPSDILEGVGPARPRVRAQPATLRPRRPALLRPKRASRSVRSDSSRAARSSLTVRRSIRSCPGAGLAALSQLGAGVVADHERIVSLPVLATALSETLEVDQQPSVRNEVRVGLAVCERERRRSPRTLLPFVRWGSRTPRVGGRLSAPAGCAEHTIRRSPGSRPRGYRDYRNRGKGITPTGAGGRSLAVVEFDRPGTATVAAGRCDCSRQSMTLVACKWRRAQFSASAQPPSHPQALTTPGSYCAAVQRRCS